MPATLLGAHMPTAGGLGKAVLQGKKIGCTAVQVFTSSPQQWKAKPITEEMIAALEAARRETGITEIVSHDSYLINLCAQDPDQRRKSIDGLKSEMHRCAQLGIGYVVSHMGAHMGQGEDCGIDSIAEAACEIMADTPDTVTLCMETTAGQGTCLGCRFEQLARIIENCKAPSRLAVCLDTCHIFVAGYDIRTEETYSQTFDEFSRVIGFDRLKVIHCNDSKKPFGSRVDRHAHIGEGEIGLRAFELLVNDSRFQNTPILLETPDAETEHERNLAKLKSLIKG